MSGRVRRLGGRGGPGVTFSGQETEVVRSLSSTRSVLQTPPACLLSMPRAATGCPIHLVLGTAGEESVPREVTAACHSRRWNNMFISSRWQQVVTPMGGVRGTVRIPANAHRLPGSHLDL
ncbi:hypothetical protein FKM82_029004 [Ascaphus truei]